MALTDTASTNASTFIQTLWSRQTFDAREENLLMVNLFDRKYEEEMSGQPYDTINIQSVPNLTVAGTLGAGGTLTHTEVTFNARVQLSIDTHVYRSFDLETELEMLSNISLFDKLTGKAGYAVALAIDDTAAGLIDNFDTNAVGALGVSLSDDDILQSVQLLNDAIAPESGRSFVMSPIQQREMYKVEKYINSLYRPAVGSENTALGRGKFADIYGMGWYMSGNVEGSNAAGHDNGIFQKEAVAVAIIDNMRQVTQYEIDTDSTKLAVHALYGMIEVRDDHGVFARGL